MKQHFRMADVLVGILGALAVGTCPAWAGWSECGIAVGAAIGSQSYSSLAPDGASGVLLAWQDTRSGVPRVYAQHLTATGDISPDWPADGLAVCAGTSGTQRYPAIVSDGALGAILTWTDARASVNDIYAQRITAAGNIEAGWPVDGLAICTATGSQHHPAVVSDGGGGAVIAWMDQRNISTTGLDIYAQRVTAEGSVAASWPTNGVAISTAPGNPVSWTLVPNGTGGVFVAWEDNSAIYAQHATAMGAIASGWPANGLMISPELYQFNPGMVSDGAGGAIITWNDFSLEMPGLYAQRMTGSGTIAPGWSQDGVRLHIMEYPRSEEYVRPISDGAGGAIVVFAYQDTQGQYDIYSQRITSSGSVASGWPADGVALCTANDEQVEPFATADGAGGAIVAWEDHRNRTVTQKDLYVQRVTATGTILSGWPSDGLALCTADSVQTLANGGSPVIVPDAGGGAYVVWEDYRNGNADVDVYAQRVRPWGVATDIQPGMAVVEGVVGWPNPFRHEVRIEFEVRSMAPIVADVYDVTGRRVRALSRAPYPTGRHTLSWDGRANDGSPLPAGTYFLRIHGRGSESTRKLLLMP